MNRECYIHVQKTYLDNTEYYVYKLELENTRQMKNNKKLNSLYQNTKRSKLRIKNTLNKKVEEMELEIKRLNSIIKDLRYDTNDTGETSDTSDTSDTNDMNDTGETNDTGDNNETNDTGDNNDTNDTSDTNDTNDTSETSDISKTYDINDNDIKHDINYDWISIDMEADIE